MKTRAACLLSIVCLFTLAGAKPLDVVGEDDASKSEYGGNWSNDTSGGTGFGHWSLQTTTAPGSDNTHAGFYIAGTDSKSDLRGAAMDGKAFGLYANGTGFEVAAAFRPFETPLKVGQGFSFLMQAGEIAQKFEIDDTAGGSIGLTLRSSADAGGTDDYNKDARFEIGYYKSDLAYVITDGDGRKKLDIPRDDAGLAVTVMLTGADTYDLEITTLTDKKTTRMTSRKLGGTAGGPIAGFCIFDRNGELNDAYFNGFQILQGAQ
jgi:hypothetical protein